MEKPRLKQYGDLQSVDPLSRAVHSVAWAGSVAARSALV